MKCILTSDSHGNSLGFDKLFQEENFDFLFFMGDGVRDLGLYANLAQVYAVSGNCDYFCDEPNEKQITLCGKKILITHGNMYGVKSGLGQLVTYAKSLGVNYVFYGHTHKYDVQLIDGIYFINPGSFRASSDGECKYITMYLGERGCNVEQSTLSLYD